MSEAREAARLDALYQLELLDTPASESFDRITRMAAQIFGLPIAAVSLTDTDRQWFKSRVGVEHTWIPRDRAPCSQVAESADVLIIPDLMSDDCYATSNLAKSGVRFYAGAPLVTRDGHGLGALCVLGTEPRHPLPEEMAALRDLAAMVMAQIELQHAFGRIDPASGLPNRNQFTHDLEDMARDGAGERRMAVFVDLARQDQINTIIRTMGPNRVDELVREAAQALRTGLGPGRIAYHVGATQFAFLSEPDVDERAYADMLRSSFAAIRSASSARFLTTTTIGLLPFTVGDTSPDDVLRSSHGAAQDARQSHGDIGYYSSDSDRTHRRRLLLVEEFGTALECDDQLRLVYQPRIDLATGACVGAEALLRWRHDLLGDISPGEFIPLIEQTSLVRATTAWVIEQSLRQLASWRRMGLDLTLSVNISAANLDEDDFVARVQLQLLKHELRPDMLELEVTESAVMANTGKAFACLQELADAGVQLAIDDFGTGHSSLAYLQQLPAEVVKIDQSFVRGLLNSDGREHILVAAMIDLSHNLGYRVVAEGIETAEAAALLAGLGCQEGQGYWFARPMEANELERWVRSRHAEYVAGPRARPATDVSGPGTPATANVLRAAA